MCGGTKELQDEADQEMGLSPRVRGNLVGRRQDDVGGGSIPACAGEP